MSEPFLERLSQFAPDAGGLNRDALLFAAGRSSARPNRGWKALASALAATQALSLVVLFAPARPLASRPSVVRATTPSTAPDLENASSEFKHAGVWAAHYKLAELEAEKRVGGELTLIESGPPLRAFARSRTSLID